ncbi:PKS-NRPS hybrid synthetase cheA-like [Lycium barbarum]|uniref:PKS-NRPS hybrid synthetase cheA-like n=1 Tax=Lycium barbarum TaxID=112863 RepID=UPI00293F70A9|nr:PKS-NRPS hybrid synthetase cheA-like [Lycium barbarum]
MNYKKTYRSREKALEMLRGSPPESYRKLQAFPYMVNKTNLGSFTTLNKTVDGHFLYAFVALSASIRGWKYCIPAVVVDGTFLKSSYAGTMLCATVLHAAGKILPLAYAIVDSENNASWDWFFRKLKQAYGEKDNMCIVSDRHDSILKAASNVYPDVPHYNCIYHLWNNVKGRFKMEHERLKPIFFAMDNAYTRADFDRLMEDMDNIDDRVRVTCSMLAMKNGP